MLGQPTFFNPVPVMKLLEVVRIPETSEETYQAMMEWGKNMKKVGWPNIEFKLS